MLEVTLRYGDYWRDEMSNAFSLANGAASSDQSVSLQNEQESWQLYADDHLTLAGVMTGVRQGDDTQKNNTNALGPPQSLSDPCAGAVRILLYFSFLRFPRRRSKRSFPVPGRQWLM